MNANGCKVAKVVATPTAVVEDRVVLWKEHSVGEHSGRAAATKMFAAARFDAVQPPGSCVRLADEAEQPNDVGNLRVADEIADPPVEMEAELLGESLVVEREAVSVAAQPQQRPQLIAVGSGEHLPCHLDVGVSGDPGGRWRGGFGK
jgi:hypothetical protein